MKRNLIYAAALAALLLMSGCDRAVQEETPGTQQTTPVQEEPAEPAPAQDPAPEQLPEEEIVPAEPVYEMDSGVWLAANDLGYSNYYYFNAEAQSGSFVSLEYGLGMPFTYEGSGNDLVFHLEGHEEPQPAVVEASSVDSFTLVWENSLPETLTYIAEGTLEDFHFYSNNDLAMLAMEHYTEDSGETPGQAGAMTNEDNTVTVQLYDHLGDHNSTAAWYILNRFTATGTDLLTGEEIDLLKETVEELPDEDETPAEEEVSTEDEIPAEEEVPAVEELPDQPDSEAHIPSEQ